MAGINGAKYKVMPQSPDTDLESIKDSARKIVEEFGGTNKEYEEEPVAFGLKSITVFFFYPHDKNPEMLEEKFSTIEGVNSVELIDMRKVA